MATTASTDNAATTDRAATTDKAPAATVDRPRNPLFSALIGLSAIAILLQGLWAGLFIHEGEDYRANWVSVHARSGDAAIVLAALATVVAIVKLRSRRDLIIGSIALTILLVLEAYIGGLIGGHAGLTAIHFPLAMALVGLAVWLPIRATRR